MLQRFRPTYAPAVLEHSRRKSGEGETDRGRGKGAAEKEKGGYEVNQMIERTH